MRTLWLCLLLCAVGSAQAPAKSKSTKAPTSHMTPAEVHRSALIVDTHADTTQRLLDSGFDLANPPAGDDGHIDFAKIKAGNLCAEFFSIWVEPNEQNKGHYAKRTLELIDSVLEQARKHPKQMVMAYSPADIEHVHKEGKFAALMGIEGGHSIENSMPLLRDFYRLGVRYMTL